MYNTRDIINTLNTVSEKNETVVNFYTNFTFDIIINRNIAKDNSVNVFKNVINEDTTKSKIIQLLNKLHQHNLSKIIKQIREIVFKTQSEIDELVYQCIQKIKKDSDQIRPLVGALCLELLTTYFETTEGNKIYFRKLLLSKVKSEYISCMIFNESWDKDKTERIMILIGTLYNSKILDKEIMNYIINDFKKHIECDDTEKDYDNVEKCIQMLSCLISTMLNNDFDDDICNNLINFLEDQLVIYENNKKISRKMRLVCKNIIYELKL